ncbi:hypothetical protein [Mycoplasma simbae]|uniref:hypothetical protein n=1 Tax=Mycoplasma simbae TaxID=36744 RepID=UPI000494EDA9|nr:hypothetical protein [Mycoplasma simbae]
MKKLILTSPLLLAPLSMVACSNTSAKPKVYTYLDFYNYASDKSKALLLDKDLQANVVYDSFMIYRNFATVDADEDEVPADIEQLKLSKVFNQEFFKNNFLVYLGGEWSSFRLQDKDTFVQTLFLPFRVNNANELEYSLVQTKRQMKINPNHKITKAYESYFAHSLQNVFLAFPKSQYVKVVKFLRDFKAKKYTQIDIEQAQEVDY